MSWFESKRHSKAHTNMYFLNEEDTWWVFERDPRDEPYRVELILVDKSSKEYDSAVNNSQKAETNDIRKTIFHRWEEKMPGEPPVFIYKMQWFDSKRHRKPNDETWFLKPEHTHWVWQREIMPLYRWWRVELILTYKSNEDYKFAEGYDEITLKRLSRWDGNLDSGVYKTGGQM